MTVFRVTLKATVGVAVNFLKKHEILLVKIMQIFQEKMARCGGKHHTAAAKEKNRLLHVGLRVGAKHPNWKGGPVSCECKHCGQIFFVKRYRVKQGRVKYCSRRCTRLSQVYPNKDSSIEVKLQEELKVHSIVFKKHVSLLGQPDLFIEPNICIFADGDFFHANPVQYAASDYIIRKQYAKDIWKRDRYITEALQKQGYTVLRFWERDIKNNLSKCFDAIQSTVNNIN